MSPQARTMIALMMLVSAGSFGCRNDRPQEPSSMPKPQDPSTNEPGIDTVPPHPPAPVGKDPDPSPIGQDDRTDKK